MTQRSGAFTRGPCRNTSFSSVVGIPVMAQPNPKEDSILICGVRGERVVAEPNSCLIVAAFNAATAAEDMGYGGQEAVEALPRLLKMLHLYSYPGDFEGRPSRSEQQDETRALLASCRAKESTS